MKTKTVRAYTNVFKIRVNLVLKRQVIDNYPIAAYIDPAQFCQLRCPECPTGLRLNMRPATTLDFDLFKAVLDEIGDYLFFLYLYNWGEPLLHKQIPEMVALAKSKDIYVAISTNLSLKFRDDYLRRLVESGLDRLIVSLDGASQETYQRYRRGGNFSLVCENMRKLQYIKTQLGLQTPEISIQFLVFQHNEHEMLQIKQSYQEMGADSFYFSTPVMPEVSESEKYDIHPSTLPEYNIFHPNNQLNRRIREASSRPCSLLYSILVMDSVGKVSPCCAVASENDAFVEISKLDSLLTAWNNDKFRYARRFTGSRFSNFIPVGHNNKRAPAINAARVIRTGDIICKYCPQPWMQRTGHGIINQIADDLLRICWYQKSVKNKLRALLFYSLTGAPKVTQYARRLVRKMVMKLFSVVTPNKKYGDNMKQEE